MALGVAYEGALKPRGWVKAPVSCEFRKTEDCDGILQPRGRGCRAGEAQDLQKGGGASTGGRTSAERARHKAASSRGRTVSA